MKIEYEIGDRVFIKRYPKASWRIEKISAINEHEPIAALVSPGGLVHVWEKLSDILPDFSNANFKAVVEAWLCDNGYSMVKTECLEKLCAGYRLTDEEDKKAVVEAWLYDHGYSMVKTDVGYDIFPIPAEDYPDNDPRHKHLKKDEIKKRLNDTFGVASIDKTIDSEDITALCQSLELLRRDISSLRYTLQDMTNFAMECEKKDRELRDNSVKSDEACKDDTIGLVPRFKIGEHVYQGNGKTRYEILDMRLKSNGPESNFAYLIGGKAHCKHWVDEDKLHY